MIGHLLIARPVVAIVSGKANIFHCALDFSFSWSKLQNIVAAEELLTKKEVMSVEGDGQEAKDVLSGASDSVGSTNLKKFQTVLRRVALASERRQ